MKLVTYVSEKAAPKSISITDVRIELKYPTVLLSFSVAASV